MEASAFIKVRLLQLISELKNLGLLYSFVLTFTFFALLFYFGVSINTLQSAIIACSILSLLVVMIHFQRSDHTFLKVNARHPVGIYFFEYSFFASVFILIACIKTYNLLPLIFFGLIYCISLIRVNRTTRDKRTLTIYFIPQSNFEWLSGIRKTGVVYLSLLILSLALVSIPFATMVLLWFSLIIVSSFYEIHETQAMLESYEQPASNFLLNKILNHIKLVIIPQVLILTLATILNPERWWVHLLFLVFSSLMVAVFIVSKYSVWSIPGAHRSVNVTNTICLTGFFIPFLLPLPIFLLIKNYRKSLHRLKPILDDYRG